MAGRFGIDAGVTERARPVVAIDNVTGEPLPSGSVLVSTLASAANTVNATLVKASAGRVGRLDAKGDRAEETKDGAVRGR